MNFATRNASAVIAAGALLATAPVSASLPELSNDRPLETVEVVEKMIVQPADGSMALDRIRLELDAALTQQSARTLRDAVRSGFETARLALEAVEKVEPDAGREEVAAETSAPSVFDFSGLEISDDGASRALSF